jgi:hypothetical protein
VRAVHLGEGLRPSDEQRWIRDTARASAAACQTPAKILTALDAHSVAVPATTRFGRIVAAAAPCE